MTNNESVPASALDESATIVTLTRVPGTVPFVVVSAPADVNETTAQRSKRWAEEGAALAHLLTHSVESMTLAVAMSKIRGN